MARDSLVPQQRRRTSTSLQIIYGTPCASKRTLPALRCDLKQTGRSTPRPRPRPQLHADCHSSVTKRPPQGTPWLSKRPPNASGCHCVTDKQAGAGHAVLSEHPPASSLCRQARA